MKSPPKANTLQPLIAVYHRTVKCIFCVSRDRNSFQFETFSHRDHLFIAELVELKNTRKYDKTGNFVCRNFLRCSSKLLNLLLFILVTSDFYSNGSQVSLSARIEKRDVADVEITTESFFDRIKSGLQNTFSEDNFNVRTLE